MAGNIYHTWNGTTLTITSDSGTSSADLKGDTGIRGPQGIRGEVGQCDTSILEDYATKDYVAQKVAEAQLPEAETVLSAYYTKTETNELVDAKEASIYIDIDGVSNNVNELREDVFNFKQYSTIPTKIGSWIDGKPIYRMAFNIDLAVADYIDDNTFAFSIAELLVDILKNTMNMNVINEFACVRYGSPGVVDDVKLTYTNLGWWECEASSINADGHDGIYGWIDFCTQESNFK